jgi:glycosyltransferase involved in cell wall biosynthesis
MARAVFYLGAKMTARFATTIVADSVEIQKRWHNEFGRGGLFIPYGGDIPASLAVEEGLTSRQYVLMVARFVPENSIQEFFDAVRYISPAYKIVIVGSSGYGGASDKAAADLATKHENVMWLGHVSNHERLLSLWQHAGAYFHGHSVGGTNPALVQAMACGAPVVARDTVYNREVLGNAGTFTSIEPKEIALSLMNVLEDSSLQAKHAEAGLKRVQDVYTWESVCEKYAGGLSAACSDVVTEGVS